MIQRRKGVLPTFFAIFALIFVWVINKSNPFDSSLTNLYSHGSRSKHARKLHLLIPATSANPNFCRTTLSAALLDYPSPIIINWGDSEDENNLYATHLAKIDGILDYLHGLPSRNDNDLVLVVDGFDVWFQLRPEVLIQRYLKVIRKRTEELADKIDSNVLAQRNIKQTVLLGADKKCWPQDMRFPACYAVPDSSLPKDLFGEETDAEGKHGLARPRWLNSGTILGPTSEVRELFEATRRRVQEHFHGYSDQWYIGEIFGDQEFRRKSLYKHPPQGPKAGSYPPKIDETKQKTEFHLGLDYESELFHTNSFAENDTAWIVFNSTQPDIFTDFAKRRFNWKEGSALTLPSDIMDSRPPIAKDVVEDERFDENVRGDPLPYNTTWGEVSLMVNMATGAIPAIIHLNGKKVKIDEWWSNLWWFRDGWGKHILFSSSRAGAGPLGITTDPNTGMITTWWKGAYNSRRVENGGYWSSQGEWLYYNEICEPHRQILYEGKEAGWSPEKTHWEGPEEGKAAFDRYEGEV